MANTKSKLPRTINGSSKSSVKDVDVLTNSRQASSRKTKSQYKPNNDSHYNSDELDPRYLMQVLTEVKNGNFSVRMPIDQVVGGYGQ